jgi:hypothetical protein
LSAGFALHDDGLEAPLKDVADAPMRAVVRLGVNAVELAHARAEVAIDRLDDDVEVVVSQAWRSASSRKVASRRSPREVTWNNPPGNSMRRGRAIWGY